MDQKKLDLSKSALEQQLTPVPEVEPLRFGAEQPHVSTEAIIAGDLAGIAVPQRIEKWWGHELIYKNDEQYCMKLLRLEDGGQTSTHFHVEKHETLLVVSGVLTIITTYNKKQKTRRLGPGTAMVVPPGFVHKLIAAEGPVVLIEASTYDQIDDSVRIS